VIDKTDADLPQDLDLPSDIYYVQCGAFFGIYAGEPQMKRALKMRRIWTDEVTADTPYLYRLVPREGIKIFVGDVVGGGGWQDVTENYVKDGDWTW